MDLETTKPNNSSFIYNRVSTDEQASEGFSLENQKKACIDYAKDRNLRIKRIFVDDGKSGRTTDRPAFQEMLEACSKNEVGAVIVYKIDRFARNVADFATIRKQFRQRGIKLLSVCENGDVTEGLIGNIFASVAEWESEVNGQRTRDALTQKFREGWQPTPPPIGYQSVGGPRERKTCKPDSFVAPIISELFHLYATGNYSIVNLEQWLTSKNILSKNGTSIGHSVVNTILSNPFYYGLIRWRGQSKTGKHKPIISKDLFETCQYVLAKHRNFLIRRRVHNFLLRGFVYCGECGQRYTAEWHPIKRSKKRDKIAYYHCPKQNRNGCPAPYVEKENLESQVEQQFKKMQFSEDFINLVVAKTKEYLTNIRKNSDSDKQVILNQKSAFEFKRNKLEDNLLDGTIDRDVFKRKHSEIQEKIDNLEDELQDIENRSRIDINLIEEVLALSRNIYQTYKDAPSFLKRHYLRFFFDRINVKNEKVTDVLPTPIFLSLQQNRKIILRSFQLPNPKINITKDTQPLLKDDEVIIRAIQLPR